MIPSRYSSHNFARPLLEPEVRSYSYYSFSSTALSSPNAYLPMTRGSRMLQDPMLSNSPTTEAHNVSDDRIPALQGSTAGTHAPLRSSAIQIESTSNGDVVVVEPSFDAEDDCDEVKGAKTRLGDSKDWQSRSPVAEKSAHTEKRSSPSKSGRRHTRDLSEHFFDATTLNVSHRSQQFNDDAHFSKEDLYPSKSDVPSSFLSPAPTSAGVGQKHRRVFSGDVSNPAFAHRRINSSGNSAAVKREGHRMDGLGPRRHQREGSAGLEILSAAVDVDATKEDFALAAGDRPKQPPAAWMDHHHHSASTSSYHFAPGPMKSTVPGRGRFHPPAGPPPHLLTTANPGPQGTYPPQAYPPGPFYPPHPSPYHPPRGPVSAMVYPTHPSSHTDGFPKHQPHYRSSEPSGRVSFGAPLGPPPGSRIPMKTEEKIPEAPKDPSHWKRNAGTNQGVQTFVTAISVGDGNKTLHPSHRPSPSGDLASTIPSIVGHDSGHHRRLSSFSSLLGSTVFSASPMPDSSRSKGGHHRTTSSSVSFLQGMEDVEALASADASFLDNLHAAEPSYSTAPYGKNVPAAATEPSPPATQPGQNAEAANADPAPPKLASGGTSKRVRRKCTVSGCQNRVVQGGLCISHGAKRKTCKHPGCTKNVKKAGLCSTHGPARKRCEAEGCSKVAVQGGRCIAHGAKKKMCSVDNCTKQAILSGMCKKHHDQVVDAAPRNSRSRKARSTSPPLCAPVGAADSSRPVAHKSGHTRGLSLFQEIAVDEVEDFINNDSASGDVRPITDGRGREPPERRNSYSGDFMY